MKTALKTVAIVLLVLGAGWFLAVQVIHLANSTLASECRSLGIETGYPTKYTGNSGFSKVCYVKPHDRWIPSDRWFLGQETYK